MQTVSQSAVRKQFISGFEDLNLKIREVHQRNQARSEWDRVFNLWIEGMITRIVEQLEITISSVHIRYENSVSHKGKPFAVGLTLDTADMRSASADWAPCPVSDVNSADLIRKVGDLESCAQGSGNGGPERWSGRAVLGGLGGGEDDRYIDALARTPDYYLSLLSRASSVACSRAR